jgi:uncharacterized membrane protein/glutaredoxin
MGKASRKKRSRQDKISKSISLRAGPNWPLLGLALTGMGLTVYLTISSWIGETVAGCTPGSACDVVLSSQWSTLFGVPTSFWGFLTYAAFAGIAFIKRSDLHWKAAWMLSLFGVFYSLYLTGISIFQLDAACPYCLTSLGLMLGIFGFTTYQRPPDLLRFSWNSWLLRSVPGAIVLVLALHLHFTGFWTTPPKTEDPWILALAEHLSQKAKFYGASWCPHCETQKKMFGPSAHRLPYVECSPGGRYGPQATICQTAGIRSYPTWIIDGRRVEGMISPQELARHSNFSFSQP